MGRGADATAQDEGRTPLHEALEWERVEAVRVLIENGADVRACEKYGLTPQHFASGWGRVDLAHLLIDGGADVTAKDNYLRIY